jgi:hypothetical protein
MGPRGGEKYFLCRGEETCDGHPAYLDEIGIHRGGGSSTEGKKQGILRCAQNDKNSSREDFREK